MILTKDVFSEAYDAIRQNRRRTAITMLGMAWGIATVVLLLAYGTGFSTAIVNIFRSYASMQSVGVVGGRTSMQAGGNKAGTSVRLTTDDIDRVVANVPQVMRITPESLYESPVSYEGRSYTWTVNGGNPVLQEIQNLQLDVGRFYSAEDMQLRARVCVLGSESKEKLFSGRFPLGEKIRINGIPYEVIGVLKPRPQEGLREQYQPRRLHSLPHDERLPRHALHRHDLAGLSRLRLRRVEKIGSQHAGRAAQFPSRR